MFDRNLIDGFIVDLDLNEVLQSACKAARALMLRARETGHHNRHEAAALVAMARAMMTPYRAAFESRTEMERAQAFGTVITGNAKFLTPACAGETCLDCDRPLWQHIVKWGSSQLCPFGREYWFLARAIFDAHGNDDQASYLYPLKIIARPSPR